MYDFRTGLQMVSDLAKASMVPSLRMGKLEVARLTPCNLLAVLAPLEILW